LGLAVFTTPLIWLTGNALLAYNVAFFVSFPLSGLAAYFLTFTIARRHELAFVAGLAFAFAPYRMAQFAHVQVMSPYWMPIALGALHRALEDDRWRWAGLFGLAWAMQALTCGYYFFYLSVLVAFWLIWFAVRREHTRTLIRIGTAWAIAAAAM